jgi:DNA-binding response OmpR family regulator
MATVRVLVAEDEASIRGLIVHHLKREGFVPLEAADGGSALRSARAGVEVAILDIGLPGIDGLEVLRALRREGRATPVLLLSARCDEVDRIVGFELGADDYVVKPFFAREVISRLRAILRRSGGLAEAGPAQLRFGRLEIDEAAREARADGKDLGLKPREFALLLALAQHPGTAFSRETLLQRVWGFDFDGDERTVDVHMRRLRMRIEEQGLVGRCLHTVHGYGYKFSPTE